MTSLVTFNDLHPHLVWLIFRVGWNWSLSPWHASFCWLSGTDSGFLSTSKLSSLLSFLFWVSLFLNHLMFQVRLGALIYIPTLPSWSYPILRLHTSSVCGWQLSNLNLQPKPNPRLINPNTYLASSLGFWHLKFTISKAGHLISSSHPAPLNFPYLTGNSILLVTRKKKKILESSLILLSLKLHI